MHLDLRGVSTSVECLQLGSVLLAKGIDRTLVTLSYHVLNSGGSGRDCRGCSPKSKSSFVARYVSADAPAIIERQTVQQATALLLWQL